VSAPPAVTVQRTASLLVLADHEEGSDLSTALQPHKSGHGPSDGPMKQQRTSSSSGRRVSVEITAGQSAAWLGDPGAGDWKRLNRTSSAVVNHSMHSTLRGAAAAGGADSPRLHKLQKALSVAAAAHAAAPHSPSAAGKGMKGNRVSRLVTEASAAAAAGPGLLEGSGGSADISALL
jgi:hypothetical protein